MSDAAATVEEVGAEEVAPAPAVQDAPVQASPVPVYAKRLRFTLDGQGFDGRLHEVSAGTGPGDAAVLWVFGSGGGLGGPAGGVYTRLGASLTSRGVASLELDHRRPGELGPCVADVMAGIAHLESAGRRRVVLVGHAFGGRVVVEAGARGRPSGVVAMSSVDMPAGVIEQLGDVPLLLVHGEHDEVVPAAVSTGLFKRAGHARQLLLYPDCGHGLDSCGTALDRDLIAWIGATLDLPA